jgi:hypothetical protein
MIIRWMLMDLEEIVILFHIKVAGATWVGTKKEKKYFE